MQEFTGRWVLEPVYEDEQEMCRLRYEISIVPKQYIPASIVRQVIKCGLPANLDALASRAERVSTCSCFQALLQCMRHAASFQCAAIQANSSNFHLQAFGTTHRCTSFSNASVRFNEKLGADCMVSSDSDQRPAKVVT